MRIECSVDEIELEGDYGTVDSVQVTCSRCQHETESFGTSEESIRRCLAFLREECPYKENNYYVTSEEL